MTLESLFERVFRYIDEKPLIPSLIVILGIIICAYDCYRTERTKYINSQPAPIRIR